jgi:hypothetical protein
VREFIQTCISVRTGVVKSACSYALYGSIDVTRESDLKPKVDAKNIQVTMEHFLNAIGEVSSGVLVLRALRAGTGSFVGAQRVPLWTCLCAALGAFSIDPFVGTQVEPCFGVQDDELKNYVHGPIIEWGPEFVKVQRTCMFTVLSAVWRICARLALVCHLFNSLRWRNLSPLFLASPVGTDLLMQVRTSSSTQLMSVLFQGPAGCGKTALAASLALRSEFPFIKIIRSGSVSVVGMGNEGPNT